MISFSDRPFEVSVLPVDTDRRSRPQMRSRRDLDSALHCHDVGTTPSPQEILPAIHDRMWRSFFGKALDAFIHHVVRHRDRQPASAKAKPDNLFKLPIDILFQPLRLKKAVLADDPELTDVIDQKGRNVVIPNKKDIQWKIACPAQQLILAFLQRDASLLQQSKAFLRKPPDFDRNFQAPVISR